MFIYLRYIGKHILRELKMNSREKWENWKKGNKTFGELSSIMCDNWNWKEFNKVERDEIMQVLVKIEEKEYGKVIFALGVEAELNDEIMANWLNDNL